MKLLKSVNSRRFSYILLAFVVSLSTNTGAVYAQGYDRAFYESNDILFYNPLDIPCSENSTVLTSNNSDYAGNEVLNSTQLHSIEANRSIYEAAAGESGIPWQLLAAIHYKETGLKKYGPSNGDGPYQILGGGYPIKDSYTDDEFLSASIAAAAFIKNKAGEKDLSDVNNIKYALFAYNGMAQSLKDQAKSLGFSDEEANNGEGSPYVMNRSDVVRDPTVEPTKSNSTWGQIKSDGGSLQYPANNDYGAFIIYAILSNISIEGGGGSCGGGGIKSGGMTLQEAEGFMDTYKNSSDSINYIGTSSRECRGGPLANCTSFSAYFINKYTNLDVVDNKINPGYNIGNGSAVVGNIISRNSAVRTGDVPEVYSVFSVATGVTMCNGVKCGHTGVVLGIDKENGKIIIGEASCGDKDIKATEKSLDSYTGNGYTYAHVGEFLKGNI